MRQIRKYQKDKGRILNSNKLLYHSIPIGCILALLLLGSIFINPLGFNISGNSNNKTYAAVDDDSSGSGTSSNDISLSIDNNNTNTDYEKSTQAGTASNSYISYNIDAKADNIKSYALSIAYANGSSSLKNTTTNATVIKDLEAATTGALPDNTWGWGWSTNANANDDSLTYHPMSTTQSMVASDPNPANNRVDLTGKLVFAAKFGEGATAGHYTAKALVSFAIEPNVVTYTYTLSYAINSQHTQPQLVGAKLPDTQTATTTETSHTFTISSVKQLGSTGSWCDLESWSSNTGGSYKPSAQITVTSAAPNVVLTTEKIGSCTW